MKFIYAILIICILAFAYNASDAPYQQVQAVIENSSKDDDARLIVSTFLSEHPKPTRGQLSYLEEQVNIVFVSKATQPFKKDRTQQKSERESLPIVGKIILFANSAFIAITSIVAVYAIFAAIQKLRRI